MTSYGASPQDLDEAYEWIISKKFDVMELISHRFPLSKAGAAFKVVCEANESMKVILEPED